MSHKCRNCKLQLAQKTRNCSHDGRAWHRYELEKELMEGSVKVDDLPEIWKERMAAYLGCTPKDDAQGVLQASDTP